jgi:uncharacterized membrane protein YoaK (UPF0700 family)
VPPSAALALAAGIGRPLRAAALLSAASGAVDAIVYQRVLPVFTANQSGNLILAGIALGSTQYAAAAASALSLVVYVLAAAGGVVLFEARPERAGLRRFDGVLALELVGLAGLAVLLWALDPRLTASARMGPASALVVAVASAAMGLQSVALRQVHRVGVLTTGATGNVTSIGVAVARLWPARVRRAAATTIGVVGVVIASYVAGAAVGAAGLRLGGSPAAWTLVPMACTALALLLGRRGAPSDGGLSPGGSTPGPAAPPPGGTRAPGRG